jgi:Skp family chaperone for outer membrane proteins
MKTTMKKLTLTAGLFAALSATAPAQADDSAYIPYAALASQVRKEINAELDQRYAELAKQVQQDAAAAMATSQTADATEPKPRDGAFWM